MVSTLSSLPPNWNASVALQEILDMLERGGDQRDIALTGIMLTSLLIQRSRTVGAVLEPVQIFSPSLTPTQRLGIRMDEYAAQIKHGQDGTEDRIELAGLLVLDHIARNKENNT